MDSDQQYKRLLHQVTKLFRDADGSLVEFRHLDVQRFFKLQREAKNDNISKDEFMETVTWEKLENIVGKEYMSHFKDENHDDVVDIEDVWLKLDSDHNGFLTLDEMTYGLLGRMELYREVFAVYSDEKGRAMPLNNLGSAIRAIGFNPSDAEVQALGYKYDTDKDGFIDKKEWKLIYEDLQVPDDEELCENIQSNFKIVAKGKDYLDREELESVFTSFGAALSQEEIQDMIRVMDANGDGKVDCKEFLNIRGEPGVSPF